ncbi:MAG: hypothetical protein IT258_19540 [Saprospiraceae bacterium]|nr:hypothetical protein [Saprospiraceae bacterium]
MVILSGTPQVQPLFIFANYFIFPQMMPDRQGFEWHFYFWPLKPFTFARACPFYHKKLQCGQRRFEMMARN